MTADDYLYSSQNDPEFNGDADREEENPWSGWPSFSPPEDDSSCPGASLVCADGVTRYFGLARRDVEGGKRIARRVREGMEAGR